MRFEITHIFPHPVEVVEEAMLDPDITVELGRRMTTIVEVEPLEISEEAGSIRRRVRYRPQPLIKKVGPKRVDPRWMEWTEESDYDRASHRMSFRNIPRVRQVADLMVNTGTISLVDRDGSTRRVVAGELKIKVPFLGRIAEKIIERQARGILDEEAATLARLLQERSE